MNEGLQILGRSDEPSATSAAILLAIMPAKKLPFKRAYSKHETPTVAADFVIPRDDLESKG